MKVPIFDEVVVNKRHRARLAHIPHLPPGEKFAVPYAYEIDDISGNIGKKLIASEGHFTVHSNEIIFRKDAIDIGSAILVFYEYESIQEISNDLYELLIKCGNEYYKINYESLVDDARLFIKEIKSDDTNQEEYNMENNKKLTLEAPWNTYRKMINALFEYDPEIEVGDVIEAIGFESIDYSIDIKVKNHRKYEALQKLLPDLKVFGSVAVGIYIYDIKNNKKNNIDTFKDLFNDNPIVSNFEKVKLPDGSERNFVCFRPEVIQFFDDDISDCYGNYNGLAEDIARAVFGDRAGDVSFSTGMIR